MEDKQEAWFWISDYCRKHGLSPWNSEIYALVYKKYIESKKQLDRMDISCQNRGMKFKGENYVEED